MKTCKKCGIKKCFENFYCHRDMSDGYLNICKACVKSRAIEYRLSHIEKIRLYDRERGKTAKRKERVRQYHKANKTKVSAIKTRWIKNNPEKRAAHLAVQSALKKKLLTKQPCNVCGAPKVEAHHENYEQPLNVVWLCSTHHAEHHKNLKLNIPF